MVSVHQALESLRDKIAETIANIEIWNTLHEVMEHLSLSHIENIDKLGKHKYLRKVTAATDDRTIVAAARQMISSYPGTRDKPSDDDVQRLQDAVWWIENQGSQQISNVCRLRIAESLEGVPFWGRLTLREFFTPAVPISVYGKCFIPQVGDDGNLYESGFVSNFFSFNDKSAQIGPARISTASYLRDIGLTEWPDQRFCLFVERLVHPEVQSAQSQKNLVERLNQLLQEDNFQLRAETAQGGLPVYKVRKRAAGVSGTPKYIIFAAVGEKPDIVIDDTVNMDIRVVSHADQCLVYDQPPPEGDLTWMMLVEWWSKRSKAPRVDAETRRQLGQRLNESLQSEAERTFFANYFKSFRRSLGERLPALLPQVYLHYDPRSRNERSQPVLVRQRMDFLMLLRNAVRIVIEIDGIHHYADEKKRALPSRYAEMVAEDRRIRLLGYEVYRFGGAEIVTWNGEKFVARDDAEETIRSFFQELFERHSIR